jgi:hypothetical protein
MRTSLFGYFFGMITVLAAAVVVLSGLSNISTSGNGRHYPRPPIGRTVMVETQRHSSPAAKEASSAKSVANEASPTKDVSPVVAAKAETENKHSKPKVLARQRNNYERPGYYGNALGYAQESRNGPQRLFSSW